MTIINKEKMQELTVKELLTEAIDGRGLPIFAEIEKDGEKIYKLDSDLSASECKKSAESQRKIAEKHLALANYYELEAEKRKHETF